MKPETFSRVLRSLSDNDTITVKGRLITVGDPQALNRLTDPA